ncbi:carbohydrate binding domain-containing protein [Phyllobacterium meliloti]|uniref:carbohydrate binding domain-containing protein n=1 Tax=Phyllobacterium meliloti TaxID=555317 RepID=UPI001D152F3E|nr:carbohydrate binding domain-containing protein [Phyllobacterium sp. T1293]UGX87128.1 carbohydrate binding domain-containing protein [Phyllobacterium sp. T1293]
MAITYPYDLLTEFPGWSTEFDLAYRQEQSRTAGGKTYVKDMGDPLWQATYQSRSMSANELDGWRARFKALENGLNQFRAWSRSRCYPIAYPGGQFFGQDSFANLLANPGFETGLATPWQGVDGVNITIASGGGGTHSGAYALLMNKGASGIGAGTNRAAFQVVSGIQANKQYQLSGWINGVTAGASAGAFLKVEWRDAANASLGFINVVNNVGYTMLWTAVSGALVAPAAAITAIVYLNLSVNGAAQYLAFDDISFSRYETFTGLNAQVNSINANRKAITLKGLNGGYTGKIGDYIQIGTRNLHQVMEDFTANTSGVTGEFEIRSHLWPESAVNDTVAVVRPSCNMTMVPGSLSTTAELATGRGTISFQAMEDR